MLMFYKKGLTFKIHMEYYEISLSQPTKMKVPIQSTGSDSWDVISE